MPSVRTIAPEERDQQIINDVIRQLAVIALGSREVLPANRTYFVATTGSDSNDGLSASTPFLTIQRAINVAAALDLSIFQVQINVAAGTYTGAINAVSYVGKGPIIINGDLANPANVLISVTGSPCIQVSNVTGKYRFQGLKLRQNTPFVNNLIVSLYSIVEYGWIHFDTGHVHVQAQTNGMAIGLGPTSITANFGIHWDADLNSVITDRGQSITLVGTPAAGFYFVQAQQGAMIVINSNTFIGSATGTRFNVLTNAVIDTLGAQTATGVYIPGNAAGSAASGGLCI